MGLFDKKYCSVCGGKIGLLDSCRKLEDGNLCKSCSDKLSPWFGKYRIPTVDQVKQQLDYREANRARVAEFNATSTVGRDSTKLYIDDNARRFTVHKGRELSADNPDILDFSQALGCELDIRESRTELRQTISGRSESYNPPRYEYSYDFNVTIRVDSPYFSEMRFKLNGRAVQTGETQLDGIDLGAWQISRVDSSQHGKHGHSENNEFIMMGNALKETIEGWKNTEPTQAQ